MTGGGRPGTDARGAGAPASGAPEAGAPEPVAAGHRGGGQPQQVPHPGPTDRFDVVGPHRVHSLDWPGTPGAPSATTATRAAAGPTALPPVVAVHGLAVSGRTLRPTAGRLAPRHRVLVPDLPGTPPSSRPPAALDIDGSADVLARWMGVVGLPPAVLLGNSIGCQVAVACAVRHPEKVAALVLAGPTMDPTARRARTQVVRWLRDLPGERLGRAPLFVRDYVAFGPRRLVATLRHALHDRIEERLPLVVVPILVVAGGRDPIVPRPWAEQAAALAPRGRLVVLPGAPHAAPFAAPDDVAAAVVTFLVDVGLSAPAPPDPDAAAGGLDATAAGPAG